MVTMLPFHHRRYVLHAEQRAAQHERDGALVCVQRDAVDRADRPGDAGRVEQDVDAAEALCRVCDQRLDVALARHVGVPVAGHRADRAGQLGAGRVADVDQHHAGSPRQRTAARSPRRWRPLHR